MIETFASKPALESVQQPPSIDTDGCYRLSRWPNFKHLDYQPLQVKIAVLLNKRSCSVDDICEICGLRRAEVEHFLNQCRQQGYLDSVAADSVATVSKLPPNSLAPRLGLLARIRHRLGIN